MVLSPLYKVILSVLNLIRIHTKVVFKSTIKSNITPILIPGKFILGYAHELVEHKSNLVDLGMSHVRSRLITMCCMGCNLSFSLKGLFF